MAKVAAIQVTIPNSTFSGYRAGIMFNNGVGLTTEPLNEGQRALFARKGYDVQGDDDAPKTAKRGGRKGATGGGDGEE